MSEQCCCCGFLFNEIEVEHREEDGAAICSNCLGLPTPEERLGAYEQLGSWALSCRKHNTDGWMHGLVEKLNDCLRVDGDSRRCHFDGDFIRLIVTSGEDKS